MAVTDARWINKGQTLEGTTALDVKLKTGGGISADADGLFVSVDLLDFRGVVDPVADGGTSVLPTAGGTDTTVQNGQALAAGQFYIAASNGTVGTALAVSAGDLIMVNGTNLPPAADGDFNIVSATGPAGTVAATRQINSGDGLAGGGDLTADRTLTVVPDVTTGGTIQAVTVGANGVGVDVVGLRLQTDLVTVTAPQIAAGAGGTITLTQTPIGDVSMSIAGAPGQHSGVDYAVAGTTATISDPVKALMVVGDNVTFQYAY